jgi:Putative addiction module component
MSSQSRRILEEALALPKKERLLIAAELHQSIEDTDSPEEIQAAWLDEIAERVQSIADGTADMVDGSEVSRRIRARYGR